MRFVGVLRAALVGAPAFTLGLACAASPLEPPPVPEAVVVVAPPPTATDDGPRGTSTGPAQVGLDAADAGAPGPDPDDGDEGDPPVGLSGLMLLLDGGVASFQLQGSIQIAGTFADDGGVRLSFTGGLFDDGGVSVSIQGGSPAAPPNAASGPPDAGTGRAAPRSGTPR